ncbi:metal ABC transporter substrate-binding protein [Ornithinimicrobium cerasi]|uniref:Zinc transport system substrate-binding protein n=1 Tax=Ornithinimicrobium cerasi TaxID=2248773 RepID=A0A285VLY0_9MICO|nr:metal ABC transporter substrate-binding protein [Ornithinimicrobium cerasi]SOC54963.1 zinc transport system substrate-binding protein [Ornithinimicrobium cerasi]
MPIRSPLPVLATLTALVLGACGQPADTGGAAAEDPARLQLVASFYPLEYVLGRVAGDRAEVTTLTAAGVDPHDVELTPRTVGTLAGADLVVHAAGLQPAVDDAVAAQAPDTSFDVLPAADLLVLGESEEEHGAHADEHEDEHGHGAEDPHFWLDPQRYADVADAVADRLAEVDPDGAATYRENAADLRADLEALDTELAEGLAGCRTRDVVTTHEAFGYLGARYDLDVVGITGISPESEPSPARLAEVADLVADLGIGTLYAEPLLPGGIAETVARETGATVLELDPVEGITEASAGADYLEVMRANLAALRTGQGCP